MHPELSSADQTPCLPRDERDIARLRLRTQSIAPPRFQRPQDGVEWLVAVQAQDYLSALWAVGLRMRQAFEGEVEQALAARTIIRTWPMRGTLHFVAAADVRWLLELLTPRVAARTASYFRSLGLDEELLARSREAIIAALEGGKQMTRDALYAALEAAGIPTGKSRGVTIVGRLAQEGLICFGAREGKQQTFVLLEEWAPNARRLERDEALAELTRRYFTSHGPATVQDLMWWSGLTATEVKAGLKMSAGQLVEETIEGKSYWMSPDAAPMASEDSSTVYLLPGYDEYLLGYKDRGAALGALDKNILTPGNNGVFSPTIVLDGRVVGAWKREIKKETVVITPSPFEPLSGASQEALSAAADRYGRFLGIPAILA